MIRSRKIWVFALFSLFIVAGLAATKPPEEQKFKNLKVLPKNISTEDLDKIMDEFKVALGVKCSFCHAPSKDSSVRYPDFASDEKPEKEITRQMMKMTTRINKKYFRYNKSETGVMIPTVECMTCHRGSPHPGNKK